MRVQPRPWALRFLRQARLGHLATSTRKGVPHVIPVCFAFDGKTFYSSLDLKLKRTDPKHLRRVLNVTENPHVSIVVDRYSEDWGKLRFVLVHGYASVISKGREYRRGISLLRKKYRQYHVMRIEERPMIKIRPTKFITWKATL